MIRQFLTGLASTLLNYVKCTGKSFFFFLACFEWTSDNCFHYVCVFKMWISKTDFFSMIGYRYSGSHLSKLSTFS
jgi:hypothetical protein